MAKNQLSGKIPVTIGNIKNLYQLNLSYNQLNGFIPSSFYDLANLYWAELSNNRLHGSIDSGISKLKNLQHLILNHNKLSTNISSGITKLNSETSFDFSYNDYTFDGIELVAQTFYKAIYNDQGRIPIHNNGNSLSVSAGGTLSNNTYQWFKSGQAGSIAIVGDSVFHPTESGLYIVKVTNKVAKKLILKSDTITYTVPGSINNFSIDNQIKPELKQRIFIIYPNPAKDIIHIQSTGKVIVTLTNQSGKIILAKTINNKGEIMYRICLLACIT